MKTLFLSCPDFSEWPKDAFDVYRKNTVRLLSISDGVSSSPVYKEKKERMKRLCSAGKTEALRNVLKTGRDVLIFCDLLLNDDEFYDEVEIGKDFIQAVFLGGDRIGLQSLKLLMRLYFRRYSVMAGHPDFDFFCKVLKDQLSLRLEKTSAADMRTPFLSLCEFIRDFACVPGKNAAVLFSETVAERFSDFDEGLTFYSLDLYQNSDFVRQCRMFYYINLMRQIPLGKAHPVLDKIVQNKDCMLSDPAVGPYLGHAALRILIDRSRSSGISKNWLNAVLEIGKDPRMPKSAQSYQYWWSHLDKSYSDQVITWLSKNDLKLFLEILKESSVGSYDMHRMFPERKRFIEKLLSLGYVTQTRLFLSGSARYYIESKYISKRKEWLNFASVTKSNTSFIFINLCNSVYMMEGTHICSLRLRGNMPKDSCITDYERERFSDHDCRSGFVECCENGDYIEVKHQGAWTDKAVKFLKEHGLDVDL